MRRLGYLSFDSNERSNHQARELKSVHVTVDAQLVRLVIHRCHVNKLNIYNQVWCHLWRGGVCVQSVASCVLAGTATHPCCAVHATVPPAACRPPPPACPQTHNRAHTQVGVIALNLIGEPLRPTPEGPAGFLETDGPVSHELPYYNRAAGELADLQLDMHVDSVTAVRIKVRARVCVRRGGGWGGGCWARRQGPVWQHALPLAPGSVGAVH
jgi:centrosomal protein CEP104